MGSQILTPQLLLGINIKSDKHCKLRYFDLSEVVFQSSATKYKL